MTPSAGRVPPCNQSPKCQRVSIALINNNGTLTTVGGGAGREVELSLDVAADDLGISGFGRHE